ncbi:DUF2834 domain-containing protein [Parvularcula sp. ZS-1/3]|uniref:DUF2834 domain-containing protein n=1 Tax=Parvularcula mediterranea TaxID=2732508 RepID=A0A7Y3RJ85_9PROT|nr:DUF2834 domain-containing protein [Parvularcula mediterranea]NNU15064.1 DUF2834 domain-containing protein [Parvularcula mediterranea]
MSRKAFEGTVGIIGLLYAFGVIAFIFIPSLVRGEPLAPFTDGFVNRHAATWSIDVLVTGAVIMVWIFYERARFGIRNGWIAWPLMIVPGVAAALAYYLIIRSLHFVRTKEREREATSQSQASS